MVLEESVKFSTYSYFAYTYIYVVEYLALECLQ